MPAKRCGNIKNILHAKACLSEVHVKGPVEIDLLGFKHFSQRVLIGDDSFAPKNSLPSMKILSYGLIQPNYLKTTRISMWRVVEHMA